MKKEPPTCQWCEVPCNKIKGRRRSFECPNCKEVWHTKPTKEDCEAIVDLVMYPETAKFKAWFKHEQKKGLLSMHFSKDGLELEKATVESFCAEVNRALAAKTIKNRKKL